MFDKKIMEIEREIEELKTARQRITAATSTIAVEIECQCKSTMNSSGTIIADTYARITLIPDNPSGTNNFIFTASQEGVGGDGTASFVATGGLGDNDSEYILSLSTLSYNGTWGAGVQKTITHKVRIIATDTFTYTVTEEPV